jgi:hypothetical protein
MPRYSSQEIDEIVDTLRSARDRGKPAHILFGAGCSKAAGIPLASEIVAEIHKRYSGYCHRLDEADRHKYGACMKLLSPNERRDLLAPYLARANINWAHIALAQFMNEKFIERALTVNFDNLLARACGLLSLYPAIYDFASAPTSDVSLIVSPAIVHLHGQGHGVVLLNTEDETKVHSAKIAPALRQSMDHPLIVIGYSGATDDVLRIVREQYRGGEYLYWLSHNDDPDPTVRRVADDHGYFKCVGGVDADRFLIELAQKLRCWPPTICTNPIGHLLAELKPVADYPTVPGSEVDILLTTRTRLAELEMNDQQKGHATRGIEKSLLEGRYDEAVRIFDAAGASDRMTNDERDLGVAALMLAGDSIFGEGNKTVDRDTAAELYLQAQSKYEAALRIKPGDHTVLYNLGVALASRARRASDPAKAQELFKQADERFAAALNIRPDEPRTLRGRGTVLLEYAKRVSDKKQAAELLNAAELSLKMAEKFGDTRTYNLACVYAMLDRADDCRTTLERTEKAGTLPAADHMQRDDDLKSVRELPWFGELIERLKKKST